MGWICDALTPAGSSHKDRAAPKFDSGSVGGTARSSPQKKWVKDQSTAARDRRGNKVVATEPPGRASEKNPRAARARRPSSSKRRASVAGRSERLSTMISGAIVWSLATVHQVKGNLVMPTPDLDTLSVNTIRTLSMDAVQQANSGHPGTPMAMAPVAYALWQRHLRFDPNDPIWPNRDRFVLSMGHASMLLYSVLHLASVKAVNPKYEALGELSVSLDDIKRFRQLDSRCPGHPEYRWTSGVETTTGPLGQGLATSVGMAMAAKWMAAHFNRPGFEMFDYRTYALGGDGCMMEGISSEAASLAGHLQLDNLCWIYDNNHITIEGSTNLAFRDDVAARFLSYGWNVTRVGDANDLDMCTPAFNGFHHTSDRPTLIIVDSHIGYGAPTKEDTAAAHGEPLGAAEVRATKRIYGWPEDAEFLVPAGVREHFLDGIGKRSRDLRAAWEASFQTYKREFPQLAEQIELMQCRELPDGWDRDLPVFPPDQKGMGGRDAGSKALTVLAKSIPWLMGGSADLAPSTKTRLDFEGAGDFQAGQYGGGNPHFGLWGDGVGGGGEGGGAAGGGPVGRRV